jgi:hypothetical protein
MSQSAAALSNEEYEERKQVLVELKLLTKYEQGEVFKRLKLHSAEFSENSNGVFFDLCKLPAEAFYDMKRYIEFCRKTREEFAQREDEERKAEEALTLSAIEVSGQVYYS